MNESKSATDQAEVERILKLRHLLAMHFREEHWAALGEIAGCVDLVQAHERLGSVHWGDNAYDACVLNVLMAVMERCPEALPKIEEYAQEVCAGCDEDTLAGATLTRLQSPWVYADSSRQCLPLCYRLLLR